MLKAWNKQNICFFRWKIEIYFISWAPSVIFSLVAATLVKILPMVSTRWNQFRSFTEKTNILYTWSRALTNGDEYHTNTLKSLPNNKILALTKFNAIAKDKIIVTQKLKIVLGRAENNVGKGENAGYQHFLLFQQCFIKLSFPEVLKVGIVW